MRLLLRIFPLLIALGVLFAACGGGGGVASSTPVPQITLNVSAAASLTDSFKAIAIQYQKAHSNVKVVYNFNGSQLLVQQIISGAPADVFASADQANMKKAVDAGLASNPQVFAMNLLEVILPASNPAHITSLKDLARKGLKIVVAAPAVPVGGYTLKALDNMGKSSEYGPSYVSSVKANFVSQEENVKSVVQKVQLGEADAGIVYRTDVAIALVDKVKFVDIPNNFNVIAQYPIAIIKNSKHASDAQAFVQYVLSPAGQDILTKYHFLSPNSGG